MATAETARLIVDLQLKDGVSPGVGRVNGAVDRLDANTGRAAGRMGVLSRATGGAGAAMQHFGGRVSGAARNLGMLGLAGAAVTVAGLLRSSVGAAQEFGDAVDRISTLTGMGASETSRFVDALGYYGISGQKAQSITGMYMKNVDALTKTKATAARFEKEYGFALLDSEGRVKSAQRVVTDFTDFFNNKQIPASQRAAAGAKIFGRSWQEILPILQKGSGEWRKQLSAGMELTKEDIANMRAARAAQRDWTDALGDFQVMLGLRVLPMLTELATAASAWLNQKGNQDSLLGFLDQGIQMGRDFVGFMTSSVIPTLSGLASSAATFWNGIPGPLRDLLIAGFAADRTVKFLFGFSIAGVATDVIGGAIKTGLSGIFGQFFARGSSPANPLFVTGAIGGGLGGGGGGKGGKGVGGLAGGLLRGAGGLALFAVGDALAGMGTSPENAGTMEGGGMRVAGSLGKIVSALMMGGPIAGAVMLAVETVNTGLDTLNVTTKAQTELQRKVDAAKGQDSETALGNLKDLNKQLGGLNILDRAIADTAGGKQIAEGLRNLSRAAANAPRLTAAQIADRIATLQEAQTNALARGNQEVADSIGVNIATLQAKVPSAADIGAAVGAKLPSAPEIGAAVAEKTTGGKSGLGGGLAGLLDGIRKGGVPTERESRRPIRVSPEAATQIGSRLRPMFATLTTAVDRGTGVDRRVGSTLQARLDRVTAAVQVLRAATMMASSREVAMLAAIARKPLSVNVQTNVSVSTYVSARDVTSRQNISNRYGASTT